MWSCQVIWIKSQMIWIGAALVVKTYLFKNSSLLYVLNILELILTTLMLFAVALFNVY